MTRLILGADRAAIRMILDRDDQVVDETLSAEARERNELVLIEEAFVRHRITWAEIDQLGVLVLPHSHTSVRITTTLAAVSGWLSDHPVVHIPTDELFQETASELLMRLERADSAA